MLTFDAILVFIVIAFILISLYFELLGPAFTFVLGIMFLAVFGVLTPTEVLSGFANEQIAVVLLLLLISELIRKTGVVEVIFDRIFRNARTYKGFLSRMSILIAFFSAFLNNTPLVAVMMPYVNSWCRKSNISPSKFLMPLSFAAILGGCATLIGTSTNLIVNGLVVDQTVLDRQLEPLGIFDFTIIGFPMIILGVLYLILFSDKILPSKAYPLSEYASKSREYTVEARVKEKSHLIGKTIEEGNLYNLPGFYLVEIVREKSRIRVITSDLVLEKDDILVFAGDTAHIASLIESNSGLVMQEVGMLRKKKRTEVIEIIVSQNSTLINKSVGEINFRSKYGAAIIAVHRNGEKISGKLSDVELKAGDVLLLFAGEDFFSRTGDTGDFYFMSKVRDFVKFETYKLVILVGGLLVAILLSALKIVTLFNGLMVVVLAAIVVQIANAKEIPKMVDYNLAIIIALSLALGIAMDKTGAADLIANTLINAFIPLGTFGILFGIYLITAVLAAYITTKAAVAIIFPIALTTANNLGLADPTPFILLVAFASAANFMTPIGFQTNLMVFGPGGYSFKDFFRAGLPLTILYMVVCVLILGFFYM